MDGYVQSDASPVARVVERGGWGGVREDRGAERGGALEPECHEPVSGDGQRQPSSEHRAALGQYESGVTRGADVYVATYEHHPGVGAVWESDQRGGDAEDHGGADDHAR